MKKTILIIVMAMIMTALFPTSALAYSDISVSGDWECRYEFNEFGVGAGGGTATVSLRVVNTHSSDNINYVSVTWGAGSASEFYQVKHVSIAPGAGMYLDFSIPVEAEDAGIPNTLWVGMSNRGSSDVDGIGAVTGIVFGPAPEYSASCEIATSTPTIDRGDTVKIAFSGAKDGNKAVDIKVYDQTGFLIFSMDNMDILYLGSKEYAPQTTTTYQFTCKVYKPGTTTLMEETLSSPVTVTVNQPATPEPDPEPDPEPAEEVTPEPAVEPAVEPEVTATPDTALSGEAVATEQPEPEETTLVLSVDENVTSEQSAPKDNSTLLIILVVLLVIICAGMIAMMAYMIKSNKKSS